MRDPRLSDLDPTLLLPLPAEPNHPPMLLSFLNGDLHQSAHQNQKFVRLLGRRWHVDYVDMCHVFKYSMPFCL